MVSLCSDGVQDLVYSFCEGSSSSFKTLMVKVSLKCLVFFPSITSFCCVVLFSGVKDWDWLSSSQWMKFPKVVSSLGENERSSFGGGRNGKFRSNIIVSWITCSLLKNVNNSCVVNRAQERWNFVEARETPPAGTELNGKSSTRTGLRVPLYFTFLRGGSAVGKHASLSPQQARVQK